MFWKMLLGAGLLVAVPAAGANAQYSPPPTASVSPSMITAGGIVDVSGQNCGAAGSEVSVAVGGGTGGSGTTTAGGNYTVPITAPLAPGDYTITVSCGGKTATAALTVLASGSLPPSNTVLGSGSVDNTAAATPSYTG